MCFRLCRNLESPESTHSEDDSFSFTPLKHTPLSLQVSTENVSSPNVQCGPCQRGNESGVAKFWCEICSEGLCDKCYIYHGRMKTSLSHSTFSVKDHSEKLPNKTFSTESPDEKNNRISPTADEIQKSKDIVAGSKSDKTEHKLENEKSTSVTTVPSSVTTVSAGIATMAIGSQGYKIIQSHTHHSGHHHSHGNKAWGGNWGTHGERAQHGHRGTLSHPSRLHGNRRR